MIYQKIVLIILIILFFNNCEKVSIRIEPKIAILGRWEIVEIGNWPVMEEVKVPGGYIEFLKDSMLVEYSYDQNKYYYLKYWIDSLLYEGVYNHEEQKYFITGRYDFMFFSNNQKLRLDLSNIAANYTTFIYKRIK